MTMMHKQSKIAGIVLAASAMALSGCSQVNELLGSEESVDYKSTVRGESLSIPPDLTQANTSTQYRAPEGTATFSDYAQGSAERAAASKDSEILPEASGIKVMRDGDIRWLSVDRPPEEVYPRLIEFWGDQGFTIQSQDPRTGVIETNWAENRKKVPEGWLRSLLKIVDQVFDSGERERFRSRMERVNGATEIYISHQQMIETPAGDEATFRWVPGKEDPNLNAVMLARLMVYLGTDVEQARTLVTQAEQGVDRPQVVTSASGQAELTLNEPFDRAWRRVGVAIDSAGFTVEDRDRSSGDYFIRYLDTDTGIKREQPNIFSRMFGGKNTTEADQFRIRVTEQMSGTVVTVLDKSGNRDTSQTAQRIIGVLADQMRVR